MATQTIALRRTAQQLFLRLPVRLRVGILHLAGRYAPWEENFDFTPPALHPDETTGPPDFVGIGTQKSGTTWWYSLLLRHPGVAGAPDFPKELHFFDRFCGLPFGEHDSDRYRQWFPRREGELAGEWTPDYLMYPWVPQMLREAAPTTKLVLLVRDPVDRFQSGFTHRLRQGSNDVGATASEAFEHGRYAHHLRGWLGQFPPSQILVLQYERCVRDPRAELARTYRFLELDDSFCPSGLTEPVNRTTSEKKVGLGSEARVRLRELYAPEVAELTDLVPDLDVDLWKNFA